MKMNLMVKPHTRVDLSQFDPSSTPGFTGGKKRALKELAKVTARLEELRDCMFAENKQRLLIILQGMDTSGKDGVVRHVFEGVKTQGISVVSFKVPTVKELARDYLWRVHCEVPANGQITVFNRSHYEDVLAVRVHKLFPGPVWRRRYDHINDFERILTDEGTTILKFFPHIDLDEQKERLEARVKNPTKQWKFNPKDLEERARWKEYQAAYEDVLSKTSTRWAPWYIIPANRKWYRNLIIARIIVRTLEGLKMKYPKPLYDPKQIVVT